MNIRRAWVVGLFLITISALLMGGMAANNTSDETVAAASAKLPGSNLSPESTPEDFFTTNEQRPSNITVKFKRLGNTSARSPVTLGASGAVSKTAESPANNSSAGSAAAAPIQTAAAVAAAPAGSTGTTVAAPNASNGTAVTPENLPTDNQVAVASPGPANGTASNVSEIEPAGFSDNASTTNQSVQDAGAVLITPDMLADNQTPPDNQAPEEPVAEEEVAASLDEESDQDLPTDRIWREGSANPYIWTPLSFSGFFYDLDDDVGTERLKITLSSSAGRPSRSLESGAILYSSRVKPLDFQFDDWGQYNVIGFMAQKYFAGYITGDLFSKDYSMINDNQLRRVLIDSDDESSITSGSVMPLEEGFELRIKEIDLNGNKVYLALAKDGDEVDSKVITPSDTKSATYMYEVDVSGEDVPLIMAHVSNVFAGAESSLVTIDGLFQISDTYASVEEDDKYDEMQVVMVSDQGIEMENEDSVTLKRGKTVKLMGDVGLLVADADEVRFAPIVEKTGTYEIRGTIINPDRQEFTWTPYNFEGFYYDIDDDVGTERLLVKLSGEKIAEGDMQYETQPQAVKFEFNDWGRYDVIGFMADKYFAGFNNESTFTDEFSTINEGELRRVLTDTDDESTISTGTVLPLEEGYELQIKQVDVNGNKVWLSLTKDGDEVDNKVISPSTGDLKASTYAYKIKVGSEDVPIIAAHISNVFRGREADLATVDGLFQVSDSPESVEEGETHGKMKVDVLSDEGITMINDGSISLGRGKKVEIMGNLKLQVADSTRKDFSPVALRVAKTQPMKINTTEAQVNKTTTIEVYSGTSSVAGARVLVEGQEIGTTDKDGLVRYLPQKTGSLQVQAKSSGYDDANATLMVRSEAEARKMSITVPPEVYRGEDFLISVKSADGSAVSGAGIAIDGQKIGTTDSQGTISHAINATGQHTVTAEMSGLDRASRTVQVVSPLKVVSLNVSAKPTAGQPVKVTAEVQNQGKQPETKELVLKVNGNASVNKTASVDAGQTKKVEFEYRPKEAGQYNFEVEGVRQTATVEETQSNWMIWAVALIVLIALGGGFYLYRSGELETLRRRFGR
ncbi:MAG: PEGA domain protein [Methanosaeta sp. PtaB.Bin039]|nr:MAG: PEGA domain protein [Methanosaeta sp. PtaB.Bin039]